MTTEKANGLRPVVILFLIMIFHLCTAQNTVKFYKVIEGDSVAMFFNENNKYVEGKCATSIRYTRLDKEGNFNGWFTDYYQNPRVIRSTGHYSHGKKNGVFTMFYTNGKIQSKGEYVINQPQGDWEFFHENGSPERRVSVTKDTLLITLVNERGDLLVDDGNGTFEGFVSGNLSSKNEILAKGKILHGKPIGKWISTFQNKSFCEEEFDNQGNFIKGVFPEARSKKDKYYQNKSLLANLIPSNYFNAIELINIENCANSPVKQSLKMDFNFNNFSDELRQKLNDLWIEDIRAGKYSSYQEEETHYMTVEFDVDENSKFNNFKLVTNWGSNFYNLVASAIKRNAKFSDAKGKLYMHLRLISRSAKYYEWTFVFSQREEIEF